MFEKIVKWLTLWTSTTVDPVSGPKPVQCGWGETDCCSIAAARVSKHQTHILGFRRNQNLTDDVAIHVHEHWTSGRYDATRVLPLVTVVHLLHNIRDTEIAEIASRSSNWRGDSNSY